MKIKQMVLSISIVATLAIVAIGEAAASVYAGSRLDIDNLRIRPTGGGPVGFRFDVASTAALNGVSQFQGGSCSGFDPFTCGGSGPSIVLGAPVSNAPGSVPIRANNDMSFFGSGGADFSNANSVIEDATLAGDPSTDLRGVAEANLDTGFSASSNSGITSNANLIYLFAIDNAGTLSMSLDADPDLQALVDASEGPGSSAQAELISTFILQQVIDDAGGTLGFASWSPQGTAFNDCVTGGGVTCVEDNDSQDLNISITASAPGETVAHSFGADDLLFGDKLTSFGMTVSNLDSGIWLLTQVEETKVSLQRGVVSEPGMLTLLGIGIMGLGMTSLRKKYARRSDKKE